jgi:hypothetical protein
VVAHTAQEVWYWTPDEAILNLNEIGPWDFLIVSGLEINEARTCWCQENLAEIPRIRLSRAEENVPHRFHVRVNGQEAAVVEWSTLGAWLSKHIPVGARLLVDMNLLVLDTLLYLLPALRQLHLGKLGCIYVAPKDYNFPEQALTDYILHPIEQPKGYAALALDPDRQGARHLVFLGFDKARAWKFIDRYDWKEDHLYVVIGDPPFVPEGVARARAAAEPWLGEFERDHPEHVLPLPATDPVAVAAFCQEQFHLSNWLDIVPLGPKPMNLGILWFYFGLSEENRGRVRLLYDFPFQHAPRSKSVSRIYFYDCSRLLT